MPGATCPEAVRRKFCLYYGDQMYGGVWERERKRWSGSRSVQRDSSEEVKAVKEQAKVGGFPATWSHGDALVWAAAKAHVWILKPCCRFTLC